MFFSKLSIYISKHVFWSVLLVLLIILSLDSLSRVVEQSGEIKGDYNFLQLLHYIFLTLPSRMVEYMPYAALIGCLMAMGLLANNNELVVMRVAGLSMWQLIMMALVPVMLFMLAAMLISEFAVPKLTQYAEQNRLQQRYSSERLFVKSKFWNREKNEFMKIDYLGFDGNIQGLSRYTFDDDLRLVKAQYADSAIYNDKQWTLYGIKETILGNNSKQLERKEHAFLTWNTKVEPRLLEYLIFDPDDLSMLRIAKFTRYLEQQNLNVEQYRLAFWAKIFYPLTAISLILITIPGVFGSMRQKSVGYRIFVGVVIGVMFRMLQNLITPAALVYDLSPLTASLFPIAACMLIGFYRLWRVP